MPAAASGLPGAPWAVAPADPSDTEVVAEFFGEFEPMRGGRYYGSSDFELRYPRVERSPTLRLRRFHNVILLPHHVILSQTDGRLLPVSFALQRHESWLYPGHLNAISPQDYLFEDLTQPTTVVEEPVFLAEAGYGSYGHMLLEAVPKLAMVGAAPAGIRVVTSTHAYQPVFAALGADRDRVTEFRGPLFCSTAYIPDPPVDLTGNFHISARAAYVRLGRLATKSKISPKRRIFFSRSRIAARKMVNEAEIEGIFAARGFDVIHPELLPVPDQIRLAKDAEMIAGPGGSAMHNLVFSPPETKAMIICSSHWFVNIDRYISKTDGQFAYVVGQPLARSDVHSREWNWTVDTALVARAVEEHFGL